MVQYYEIAGKAVSLHPIKLHVCHVAYIARGSKELIILCTNLTVRLKQQLAHYLSYQCNLYKKFPKKKNQNPTKKMPSAIKTLKQMTYEAVRSTSFTKIHGRPTRSDYKNLKKEASDLANELDDITYDWSRSPTGKDYGLLAKIIGENEYKHLTGQTWVQETKPATYDPNINDTTATHTRKRMEQEWDRTRETWAIRKGFLQGIAANFQDALNENWYSQLKSVHTAYRSNTTPIQILDHLNT
jgi:hypothetical protein